MIRQGDTIENPITGEQVTFLKTSAETGGEYVLIETTVAADGFVAAEHVHPYQSERFEVLSGEVEFQLDAKTVVAKAGEVVMVEPGAAHRFRNIGEEEVRFLTEVRPALSFERSSWTSTSISYDCPSRRPGCRGPVSCSPPRSGGLSATSRPTSPITPTTLN